jgi:hypothetical protein
MFVTAFSYEKNIHSWEKIGALPFTMDVYTRKYMKPLMIMVN